MATDAWVNETLYAAWGQRFLVKRELARVRSDFQDIMLFESHTHGRVMLLDGVVQITEADEFVYQEMLAHVPLLAHGAARRVLIIGAGETGELTARALHERGVETVFVANRRYDRAIGLAQRFDGPRREITRRELYDPLGDRHEHRRNEFVEAVD